MNQWISLSNKYQASAFANSVLPAPGSKKNKSTDWFLRIFETYRFRWIAFIDFFQFFHPVQWSLFHITRHIDQSLTFRLSNPLYRDTGHHSNYLMISSVSTGNLRGRFFIHCSLDCSSFACSLDSGHDIRRFFVLLVSFNCSIFGVLWQIQFFVQSPQYVWVHEYFKMHLAPTSSKTSIALSG